MAAQRMDDLPVNNLLREDTVSSAWERAARSRVSSAPDVSPSRPCARRSLKSRQLGMLGHADEKDTRQPMKALRLPRKLNDEPAAAHLAGELVARAHPLWEGGDVPAVQVEVGEPLADALRSALACGRILRGFEGAERALAANEMGLRHADRKTGVERGARVSRLLVLTDDGAERFYRNVESLLRKHAPRVLALRLQADENTLGGLLFGPEQRARLLLVEHKDAVTEVLLALAEQWNSEPKANGPRTDAD